jgi:hypothetical protein
LGKGLGGVALATVCAWVSAGCTLRTIEGGTCGNGVIDDDEVCDDGAAGTGSDGSQCERSGALACRAYVCGATESKTEVSCPGELVCGDDGYCRSSAAGFTLAGVIPKGYERITARNVLGVGSPSVGVSSDEGASSVAPVERGAELLGWSSWANKTEVLELGALQVQRVVELPGVTIEAPVPMLSDDGTPSAGAPRALFANAEGAEIQVRTLGDDGVVLQGLLDRRTPGDAGVYKFEGVVKARPHLYQEVGPSGSKRKLAFAVEHAVEGKVRTSLTTRMATGAECLLGCGETLEEGSIEATLDDVDVADLNLDGCSDLIGVTTGATGSTFEARSACPFKNDAYSIPAGLFNFPPLKGVRSVHDATGQLAGAVLFGDGQNHRLFIGTSAGNYVNLEIKMPLAPDEEVLAASWVSATVEDLRGWLNVQNTISGYSLAIATTSAVHVCAKTQGFFLSCTSQAVGLRAAEPIALGNGRAGFVGIEAGSAVNSEGDQGGPLLLLQADVAGFVQQTSIATSGPVAALAVGDFDSDGMQDLVAQVQRPLDTGAMIVAAYGTSQGLGPLQSVGATQLGEMGAPPPSFGAGDVDGNGLDDVVVVPAGPLDFSKPQVLRLVAREGRNLVSPVVVDGFSTLGLSARQTGVGFGDIVAVGTSFVPGSSGLGTVAVTSVSLDGSVTEAVQEQGTFAGVEVKPQSLLARPTAVRAGGSIAVMIPHEGASNPDEVSTDILTVTPVDASGSCAVGTLVGAGCFNFHNRDALVLDSAVGDVMGLDLTSGVPTPYAGADGVPDLVVLAISQDRIPQIHVLPGTGSQEAPFCDAAECKPLRFDVGTADSFLQYGVLQYGCMALLRVDPEDARLAVVLNGSVYDPIPTAAWYLNDLDALQLTSLNASNVDLSYISGGATDMETTDLNDDGFADLVVTYGSPNAEGTTQLFVANASLGGGVAFAE